MAPSRTWPSTKGSIIPCSRAMRRIQRSDLMDIPQPSEGSVALRADEQWTGGAALLNWGGIYYGRTDLLGEDDAGDLILPRLAGSGELSKCRAHSEIASG